jgi:crossover junction endodeoxyribonuclease RusA
MDTLAFDVIGSPVAQPRPRACRRGSRVGVYDPGTSAEWKLAIMAAAQAVYPPRTKPPISEAVEVHVVFRFLRPRSHYRTGKHAGELRPDAPRFHTTKPDRDNLDKAVLDALVRAMVLEDDALVVGGVVAKTYARGSEPAGAYVVIRQPDPEVA